MFTITNNVQNEIIIKNSKFITKLIKINNENEINDILINIKNTYKDATHYCYAYIIGNIKRMSDDGEPSGTAGIPILNVLEKNNLNYILAIVIRYFGGIKLGAGGLIRTYNKCIVESLKKSELIELNNGYEITIEFSYESIKEVDYLLKNCLIIDKSFDNNVIYKFNITLPEYIINENLINNYKVINKKEIIF